MPTRRTDKPFANPKRPSDSDGARRPSASAGRTPERQASTGRVPARQASTGQAPVRQTRANQSPVSKSVPGRQPFANQAPVRQGSVRGVPSRQTPAGQAPVRQIPSGQASPRRAPVRRASQPVSSRAKGGLIAFIIVVALAIVYSMGFSFFQGHLFPRTSIGTTNLGLMTYEEAGAAIPQSIENYTLTITGLGENTVLSSADLGVTLRTSSVEELGLTGNAAAWPIELFVAHTATSDSAITFDESKLASSVNTLVTNHNAQATAAITASLTYNASSNTWVAKDAQDGTVLDESKTFATIRSALSAWQPSVTLSKNEQDATVSAATADYDTLKHEADQLNALYDFDFTLMLGTSGTCRVNRKYALEWSDIDAAGNVTASQAKFDAWVERLASSLDTVGGDRNYTRADGKAISVSGGTYGWTVDHDTVVSAVSQGVSSKTGNIEVTCSVEGSGFQGPDGPDFGRYIDVDITEQHARLYEADGTVVWETDVITGYDDGTYDTPTGVYVINRKESPSVLQSSLTSTVTNAQTGQTEEVTQTFRHEVSYWMPFISNFIGFHDATWQTEGWGGDLYHDQRYGSGGCVNLPLEMAESLYGLVEAGTVVSVHF